MKKQETVVYCLEKCKNIEIVFMIEVWSDGWKLRVDVKDFRADQGKEMTMKGNIAQGLLGGHLDRTAWGRSAFIAEDFQRQQRRAIAKKWKQKGTPRGEGIWRGSFPIQMMSLNSNGGILWIGGLWRTVTVYGFL